jgi:hypothetical protein
MRTEVNWMVLITMGGTFVAYLLGVRLLEAITDRLHSIRFIKSVHTIIFVPLSGLLFIFLYEVFANRVTYFTWVAVAVFLAEGAVLALNHGRCPLTSYAERLGSTHAQITDFFFPKWFANHVFEVYTSLFVVSLVRLVYLVMH